MGWLGAAAVIYFHGGSHAKEELAFRGSRAERISEDWRCFQ